MTGPDEIRYGNRTFATGVGPGMGPGWELVERDGTGTDGTGGRIETDGTGNGIGAPGM